MKIFSGRFILLIGLILLTVPCYAVTPISDMKIAKFVLFDINADGKQELIAEKEGKILFYQIINNRISELGKIDPAGNIQSFMKTDQELYVLINKVLYTCSFTNGKPSLIKVKDLSAVIDYAYKIYRDSNKTLNIIGEKAFGNESYKKEIRLIKISSNQLSVFQLKVFNSIYALAVVLDKDVNVILIHGFEERIDGLDIYKIKNDKLVLTKNFIFPKNTFTSASFFPIGKSLYVSGWKGNVDTVQAYAGIFKLNPVTGKIADIIKVKSDPYWIDIGNVDADSRQDFIWTDENGINMEFNHHESVQDAL